mmetsp:Transcript_58878/g.80369  ORF Transcript_58878/g.80369 Transcript_58878/m.80369 type:complete len:95 (-) Transcript_58878:975-1259(-)
MIAHPFQGMFLFLITTAPQCFRSISGIQTYAIYEKPSVSDRHRPLQWCIELVIVTETCDIHGLVFLFALASVVKMPSSEVSRALLMAGTILPVS